MTSAVLVDIRDEVTCPICLELLTEPLSIDCGHSFCQDCITGSSDKSVPNQEGKNRCPVCRTAYQPENLRPNRHLAIIVKRFRGTVLGPGKQREVILCGLHGEKLQLFCKEDGKLICWLCERSQEHHGHHTFLMEEVAKDYQVGAGPGLEFISYSLIVLVWFVFFFFETRSQVVQHSLKLLKMTLNFWSYCHHFHSFPVLFAC